MSTTYQECKIAFTLANDFKIIYYTNKIMEKIHMTILMDTEKLIEIYTFYNRNVSKRGIGENFLNLVQNNYLTLSVKHNKHKSQVFFLK